ncbi:hypothetical protein CQA53_10215 [Helicobacter didelphidarum]|uniref:Uncharacterized protein n=1 Tax=Helicobacter didelphidarum TaxID=2040648 RepID=A0A3D8I8B5_9HELI|nr:hypothetical protein [Helicobacter didelphidarum]RDU61392.1 hypothetical protein CQA53_10215 [Helicobacter didelphidarum]
MSEIIKDNDRESQRDKANADSTKLDSDDDKIIWELRKKKGISFLKIWFYISRIVFIIFYIYVLFKYASFRWGMIMVILFLSLVISLLLRGIFVSINFKRIYITKDKLIIERNRGDDIVLTLGTFCTYESNDNLQDALFVNDTIVFLDFNGMIKYDIFQHEFEDNVLKEFQVIIKQHYTKYLLNLAQENYLELKKKIYLIVIPFNEIDKLREERDVKSNLQDKAM